MSNVVLDYAFKVSASTIIPTASVSWLKAPAVVLKPNTDKTYHDAGIYKITAKEQFADYTDNENVASILDVRSWCYVILSETLDLADILEKNDTNLFTVLISADFTTDDFGEKFANLKTGTFEGVVAYSHSTTLNTDKEFMESFAKIGCGFDGTEKNMYHAFSALLGGVSWKNQQYIEMPEAGFEKIGDAEYDFEKRMSFVLNQDVLYYLAMFATKGRAIIAPYVIKEIIIKQQSKALSWIAANQPSYNIVNAKLLEDKLNEVYEPYLKDGIIQNGFTTIELNPDDSFSCKGNIEIDDPKALWRVFANLTVNS